MVFRNIHAVRASAAITSPKKWEFRLVSDYRALNKQIEKILGVMPNQVLEMADLRGATCFEKLDMLQGYCQMPLAAEAQEMFTIATPEGLFTPTHVPKAFCVRRPTSKM